jgi:hypothetical protein
VRRTAHHFIDPDQSSTIHHISPWVIKSVVHHIAAACQWYLGGTQQITVTYDLALWPPGEQVLACRITDR